MTLLASGAATALADRAAVLADRAAGLLRLEDQQASRPVTEWPARIALTVLILGFITLALWGMRHGWTRRAARQAGIPAPAPEPETLGAPLLATCSGVYLASTRAGDWLDRVVVHGLGSRSRAELSVGELGVRFVREGAPDLFVPTSSLRAVRVDRGIAGAVYEQGGVVVLTWDLGGTELDTGFRAKRTEDHVEVAAAVESLLRRASDTAKGATS